MERISSFVRAHKNEILLFILAFAIRGLYALAVQLAAGAHGFISFSDAEYFYYAAAKNLLAHHSFSIAVDAPYYPDAYHTPLYPLFLAGLLALHLPLFAVVLVQDAVAAAGVVLLYRIALGLTDSRAIALGAGIVASIEPMSIYWSGLLMSDVFFCFLLILSFYCLSKREPIAASFVVGLAILTRPIALYFLPAYVLFVIYQHYETSKDFRLSLLKGVAMIVIAAAVISPWLARNKINFDTWSLSSGGWYNLYVQSARAFALQHVIPFQEIQTPSNGARDYTIFSFEYTPKFKAAYFSVIKQDLPGYVLFQAKRSLWSLVSNRYDYLIHNVIAVELAGFYSRISGVFPVLLALGEVFLLSVYAFASFALYVKPLRGWWVLLFLLIAINALISGGLIPGGTDMSRYSLPLDSLLYIFAGVGLSVLTSRVYVWNAKARRSAKA